VLDRLYESFEATDQAFQAMVGIAPDTVDLRHAVAEEQLGNAPRLFWIDRATRMLYFSIAAITTTGFGDILPMTAMARLMAALECLSGIILAGAFYQRDCDGPIMNWPVLAQIRWAWALRSHPPSPAQRQFLARP
jgi:ion channel